jgi:hypothetical protein
LPVSDGIFVGGIGLPRGLNQCGNSVGGSYAVSKPFQLTADATFTAANFKSIAGS